MTFNKYKKALTIPFLILACFCISSCSQSDSQNEVFEEETKKFQPKISVQLWSVGNDIKEDFKGTISKLSEMGFDGVEFARDYGPFKNDGKGLKQYLKSVNLEVSGTHVELKEFSEENIKSSVEFYKNLGSPMLILAWDERAWDKEKINEFIEEIKAVSKSLNEFGLRFGFHNHDKEFGQFNETTFWDHIAVSTPKDLILQLDVGWVTVAGKDPVEYVNRYPDRTIAIHYKASLPLNTKNKLPLIGQDVIDWQALLMANSLAETEWIVLEQEEYPSGLSPMESVKASKLGLDRMLVEFH